MNLNKQTLSLIGLAGALPAALWLAGCGGSSSTGATRSAKASILLTDGPREDYGHVWATIYKVTLTPQDGSAPVTVFEDATGRQIDLKTLRDATGERYAFLSSASVPAGTYTGASVTVGSTMQLIKTGQTTGDALPVDASVPKDSNGNPVLALTFKAPKTVDATATNVVVDFNLARFIVRASGVLPAVGEGVGDGLRDASRHEHDEYHGSVSALDGTSPTQTFTLNRGNGMTVSVVTTASTAVYGGALANDSVVEVEGALDPTTQNLVATQIEVRGASESGHEGEGHRKPRVLGPITTLNTAAGTFVVAPRRVRGFPAGTTTVNVTTSASTVFRGDGGAILDRAVFFARLDKVRVVLATGTYDAATNTLSATEAKIVDRSHDGGFEGESHQGREDESEDNHGGGDKSGSGKK